NLIRVRSIDTPPYDGYEYCSNTFQPTYTVENMTNVDRFVVIKGVLTDLTTGTQIYARTDSDEVTNHSFMPITGSVYNGLPCGKYKLTVTISVPSAGTDAWTFDNVMSREFVYL